MRRLFTLGLVFLLSWCGWWVFAAFSLENGIARWLDDRRGEGWQAEVQDISTAGFPASIEARLVNPALADPHTGVAFEASQLVIRAPAWWPGYAQVVFPAEEMVFASPEARRSLLTHDATADLRLKPGTALELEEMALTSGAWALTAPEGSIMAAQGITMRMRQADTTAAQYDFTLQAPAFQPGSLPRRALRIPADWPIAFDSLALEMTVLFDRPFDITTLEAARPQPRRIDMPLAEAAWGKLLMRAAAGLDVSDSGLLTGEVSLQMRNWRDMLKLAETAGVLPAALRPQVENILAALARGGGNPDAIDLELSLRNGNVFLGFIPLGPAPRLVLR